MEIKGRRGTRGSSAAKTAMKDKDAELRTKITRTPRTMLVGSSPKSLTVLTMLIKSHNLPFEMPQCVDFCTRQLPTAVRKKQEEKILFAKILGFRGEIWGVFGYVWLD